MQTVLNAVDTLPVEQQLQLAYFLMDRAYESGYFPPLSEARKAALDRAVAEYEANPTDVYTFAEIVESAKRP